MPKTAEAAKSKFRGRSVRKPLHDVSNVKRAIKCTNFSKTIPEDAGGQVGDDSLDRLLLVHSDLSSLLRQIDELVVQALQSKSSKGMREIKQFADVLSDMQISLKPWVPRFQEALLNQSTRPESKSELPIERSALCVPKESTNAFVESPEPTKWESLVSPSPLVSWRAECNTEGGRQLFLLTPLPQRKAFSSKCQASSLPAFEKVTSDEINHLSDSLGNLAHDLPKGMSAKPTPNRTSNIEVTKAIGNLRTDHASPEKFSRQNSSLFVMTPCLKASPPKSCMLLEPISELAKKKTWQVHRCTPFAARLQICNESEDSDYSSGRSSDDLKLKYPELYGIEMENLQKRTVAEDSPNWTISPPKTCVIMEPTDDTLLGNQEDDIKKRDCPDVMDTVGLVECTPMIKEPKSSFRMGKHPGENTLKKELWTKFEEASTSHGFCFNSSLLQTTSKKGFLDQLDEVFEPDA